jgi:hypothetical protein
MSTCSCGVGGNSSIPKPREQKKYATVEKAFDPIMINQRTRKFTKAEIFLIIVILGILYMLVKDIKC